MYIHSHFLVYTVYIFLFLLCVDALLDKKTEVIDMMVKHGILEGLCEIFSTSSDEDTLV